MYTPPLKLSDMCTAITDLKIRYMALKRDEQLEYQNMFKDTLIKYGDLQLNQEVFGEGDELDVNVVVQLKIPACVLTDVCRVFQ